MRYLPLGSRRLGKKCCVARLDPLLACSFVAFGKGSGHPAAFNFGDVFSYAFAKVRGLPLLYKGDDFAQTDVMSAIAAGMVKASG